MLTNRRDINGVETIEDLRHPFVRLPEAAVSTLFRGWGPKI